MTLSLGTIGSVLSTALSFVVALEQSLPGSGLGATKKQIALNAIELGLQAATGVEAATGHPEIANITFLAGSFIDQTVAILNAAHAGPFAVTAAPKAA